MIIGRSFVQFESYICVCVCVCVCVKITKLSNVNHYFFFVISSSLVVRSSVESKLFTLLNHNLCFVYLSFNDLFRNLSSISPICWLFTMIYLWRKVGSLFCNHEIHQIRMLQILFLVFLESSWQGRVHGLGSMMFGFVVQKFLNIEWFLWLKIKLYHKWKFWKNWNVPLVLLERSWWAGFNGIYLVKFIFGMWEKLI
jgi:hypothetical protein